MQRAVGGDDFVAEAGGDLGDGRAQRVEHFGDRHAVRRDDARDEHERTNPVGIRAATRGSVIPASECPTSVTSTRSRRDLVRNRVGEPGNGDARRFAH